MSTDERTVLLMIPTPSLRIRAHGPHGATHLLTEGRGPSAPADADGQHGFGLGEHGFGLIEVLISCLLVATIAIGTFTGFDVTNKVTADQRARAQADTIAQQWEERLRGVQTSDIAALQKSFCVNDEGVEVASTVPCPASVTGYTGTIFTVETTGKFVSDTSGAGSCSKESGSADYIQTTTQVTWPGIGSGKPVSETSIVTPPVSGQLLVQDYNGPTPVPGVNVTAVGPEPATTSKTLATGPSGCALFTTLEAGTYAVGVNQVGYVEKDGKQSYSTTRNLVAGSSSNVSIAYDRAGQIKAGFVNAATGAAVKGETFMAINPLMTVPRGFGTANAPVTEVASPTSLFPFYYQTTEPATHSYTVYAGGCVSNDPSAWEVPSADKSVDMAPGGIVGLVKLEEPPVSVLVTKEGSAATKIENASGSINEVVTGLPPKIVTPVVSPTSGPTCGAAAQRTFTSTPGGALPVALTALPFGKYELCVAANLNAVAPAKWYRYKKVFENKVKAGTALGTVKMSAAESFGTTKPAC